MPVQLERFPTHTETCAWKTVCPAPLESIVRLPQSFLLIVRRVDFLVHRENQLFPIANIAPLGSHALMME
jgi:hypothetical protein